MLIILSFTINAIYRDLTITSFFCAKVTVPRKIFISLSLTKAQWDQCSFYRCGGAGKSLRTSRLRGMDSWLSLWDSPAVPPSPQNLPFTVYFLGLPTSIPNAAANTICIGEKFTFMRIYGEKHCVRFSAASVLPVIA